MLRLLLELILQTHLEALLHFVSLFLITLAFFGQVQLPYLNLRTPQNCNFRCQVIYLGSILFLFLIGGGYGVALFFLISGFVIPFSLRKSGFLEFLVSRMFRIVPTYFFGFTITLLAIFLCSCYFGRDWPFSYREIFIHYIPGIRDLFWTRGIDGIIWTLERQLPAFFYSLPRGSLKTATVA